MEIRTSFSARLVEIMALKGLTQMDLANMVGVAQGTVSGWLNGSLPQPRMENVLCEKLEVSRDWLIEGKGSSVKASKTSEEIRLGLKRVINLSEKRSIKFLGGNLKAIRGSMSPREFSEMLGISTPAVYQRYENGRLPRPVILQKIALTIGATLDELLTEMPGKRVAEIRAEMTRVSKESIIPSGRHESSRTRLVLLQARREFVTDKSQKILGDMFDLKNLETQELFKLYRHLESTTFDAPLELGRYYYPFLDAVGAEVNRRSDGKG